MQSPCQNALFVATGQNQQTPTVTGGTVDCFSGRHLDFENCVLDLDVGNPNQFSGLRRQERAGIFGRHGPVSLVYEELRLHGDLQTAILGFFT